jgi:hypothetical protein
MTICYIAFFESYLSTLRPFGPEFSPCPTQLKAFSRSGSYLYCVQILYGEGIFKDLEDRLENTLCAVSS